MRERNEAGTGSAGATWDGITWELLASATCA
jgi:hypothetical protein